MKSTQTEFAKKTGMSKQSIYQHIKKNGKLYAAYDKDSKTIDESHPSAMQFLQSSTTPQSTQALALSDDIQNLTVKEAVEKYGDLVQLKIATDALKNLTEYKLKELKLEETRGTLVLCSTVELLVFDVIEQTFQRLVDDIPNSLVISLEAHVKAEKEPRQGILKMLKTQTSNELKSMKKKLLANLNRIKK